MSIDLHADALWLDLPPARKLVLAVLCSRANFDTGECWPGREEIAVRASVSLKTVTEHLAALEVDGYLRSGPNPKSAGKTTHRWVNTERIHSESEARQSEYRRRKVSVDSSPSPSNLGDVDGKTRCSATHDLGEAATSVTVSNRQRTAKRQGFKKPERISYADLPRSDESDLDRPPDAKVERWLIKEIADRFGAKVVAKHLKDCDLFFVWRKIKELVDEGERGVLKDLMPRAMAEYQAEVASIAVAEPDDDAPEVTEIYRQIAADNQAKAEEEYREWERTHYPATA